MLLGTVHFVARSQSSDRPSCLRARIGTALLSAHLQKQQRKMTDKGSSASITGSAKHEREENIFNPGAMDAVPLTETGSKASLPEIARQVDVRDKIALVTGANSGCGFETSVHLARMGCIIVMACRDMNRAEDARRLIMERANLKDLLRIRVVELELSDLDDVANFPTRYDHAMGELKDRPIDMLILNAGIMAPLTRTLSKQGFELQLAVNVLGHFKLVSLLIDRVRRAQHGRIVFVGSALHFLSRGKIDFDDLNRDNAYWKWVVYAETKLGTLQLAQRLNRLLEENMITNVLVVSCHPGYAATKIHIHTMAGFFNNLVAQSADRCAKSFVVAAVDPNAKRGDYCGPRFFLYGDPAWGARRLPAVFDQQMQDHFWETVERMTKERLESKIRSWTVASS
jgi:NAD(P)-dependent dehydrogenase (short-subunit alcohol dehydrogenase family)